MAFVTVPKDLTRVKSKVFLHLTMRQILCFGAGAMIGIPVYLLTKGALGTTTASIFMILILMPFLAFALYEKDGMPLEKVLLLMIRHRFIRPWVRPYRMKNLYELLSEKKEGEIDKKKS